MHGVAITPGGGNPDRANIPPWSAVPSRDLGDVHGSGILATLAILLHAYSLGGGTYTGIEAVSNGLQILREPRAETGKRTMLYMAISLGFHRQWNFTLLPAAPGCHEPGKTFNASLFGKSYGVIFGGESSLTALGHRHADHRSGDIAGRGPGRFYRWSARALQHGVGLLGAAPFLPLKRPAGNPRRHLVHGTDLVGFLIYTQGRVSLLVVMYSINVFLTFTLSQLGMCQALVGGQENRGTLAAESSGINGLGLTAHRDDSDRHRHDQIRRGRMGNFAGDFSSLLSLPDRALVTMVG